MTAFAPGERVRLQTRGPAPVEVAAWRVGVQDARRAGLVILHALCGVTPHIRRLCGEFAEHGYETLAPALLDPPDAAFPSRDTDAACLSERLSLAEASAEGVGALPRVQAAIDALAAPVMVMGFCFGGSVAWLAAARCSGLAAAACFYGGWIAAHREETPLCPTLLHFGKRDPLIPQEEVALIADRHPETPIHLYDAGHAFMAPSDFHADSARLATLRTLQLFHRAAGAKGEMGG